VYERLRKEEKKVGSKKDRKTERQEDKKKQERILTPETSASSSSACSSPVYSIEVLQWSSVAVVLFSQAPVGPFTKNNSATGS
jgi:hypothetical protein